MERERNAPAARSANKTINSLRVGQKKTNDTFNLQTDIFVDGLCMCAKQFDIYRANLT